MANILIVDDSPIMRRNLKKILINGGYNIIAEASDGLQAIEQYEKHLPDLVTMDITMPIMNGLDALKKIIEKFPDAKIIMISAIEEKDKVYTALKCGAIQYILKPISPDRILALLKDVLSLDNNK